MDQQEAGSKQAGTKQGAPRRLGRGLSSLIGPAPVRVDVPPESGSPDVDVRSPHNITISNAAGSGATAPSRPVGGPAAGPARSPVGGPASDAPDGARGVPGDAAESRAESMAARAGSSEVMASGQASGAASGEVSGLVVEGGLVMVRVGEIVPSPFQPRVVFDDAKIAELAASIRSIGMMQPIIVRPASAAGGSEVDGRAGSGGGALAGEQPVARYELVAGERRWRAAREAGLTRVPAIVREISDDESAAWGLIENVQREDLDPIEKGEACRVMMERFGLSHQDLADRLGLDRSTIVNMVRMTELDETIQTLVRRGDLTMGHARALLAAPAETGARLALATLVSMEGWSVRKLEQEVKKVAKGKPVSEARPALAGRVGEPTRSASLADLEKRLGEHLGTRVKIKTDKSGKRGRIELAFFDLDHFEGLMEKMGYGGER